MMRFQTSQDYIFWGSLFAFSGIAAGAFGAHGLKSVYSADVLVIYETAVRYQMYHALALTFVGCLRDVKSPYLLQWSGICWTTGIFVFSGSLYALVFTGIKRWGMITPLGGMLFLLGWFFLFLSSRVSQKSS